VINTTVIASEARQSSALAQPLDCRVATLLAMTSSLRVSAPPRESYSMLGCARTPGNLFTRRRGDAEGEVSETMPHIQPVSQIKAWMLKQVQHDEVVWEESL
jgi:hypothetical protein